MYHFVSIGQQTANEVAQMRKEITNRQAATERKAVNYQSEYIDTLNRLLEENEPLAELKYFLDTAYLWSNERVRQTHKPDVVILGTGIPEELIYAAGANPYWLTGGSFGSLAWSDDIVPRDTDPVSRSILGYIHQPNGADFSDSLFIVPLSSDSMRKIAFELKEDGRSIVTVDIPAQRDDKSAREKWHRQMLAVTEAVAKHTGNRVTRNSVLSAAQRVSRARNALKVFLDVSRGRSDIITDSARLFIAGSYYLTDNIDSWTFRLQALAYRIYHLSVQMPFVKNDRPGVLLMGSPVVFPNYKIPFLIADTGLEILDTADPSAVKGSLICDGGLLHGGKGKLIRTIASVSYMNDASSAFVNNLSLQRYVSGIVSKGETEGVVYHVLKGQIEYDFELEHFEKLFSAYGIPVFRLETDYQYQDVEQLRIRLEAFSEMLVHNRCREVKKAL